METINHECYVPIEVAKLLKEAGFDWEVYTYYTHIIIEDLNMDETTGLMFGGKYNYNSSDDYSAPSLSIAQRWLREVKNIDINILAESISSHKQYLVSIWFNISSNSSYDNIILDSRYTTYEEAQEAGIKKALEIILEKGE